MKKLEIQTYGSMGEMFNDLMPIYRGKSWKPFAVRFKWDRGIADFVEDLSPKRAGKRRRTYLIDGELERATQSIRFGNEKTGHGYHGQRKDFCLVGGVYEKKHLTVFYRTVELIGGFHYDTVIFREVEDAMGPIKTITIMAVWAAVFARAGGSNQILYPKLKKFYNR